MDSFMLSLCLRISSEDKLVRVKSLVSIALRKRVVADTASPRINEEFLSII